VTTHSTSPWPPAPPGPITRIEAHTHFESLFLAQKGCRQLQIGRSPSSCPWQLNCETMYACDSMCTWWHNHNWI
jgi:hypothetical protein